MKAIAALMVGILASTAALAQADKPVPLSIPPKGLLTTPVDQSLPPRLPEGTTPSSKPSTLSPSSSKSNADAAASSPPATRPMQTPAPTADPNAAQALRELVKNTMDGLPGAAPIKPPPPDITIKEGVTEMVPVAQGRMNRFLTPFPDPVIKMSERADADVSRAGNIIYVLINSATPLSMFVMDRSDPEHAMSLTLVPSGVPPVQVTLHMNGWKPPSTTEVAYAPPSAQDVNDPYVDALLQVMRSLALHQVPDGYSLLQQPPADLSPLRCRIAGVSVTPAQWVVGHTIGAIVARVTNQTIDGVDLHESDCADPSVLAVAAWPRNHLEPGDQTELYVVLRRRPPPPSGSRRPSVLSQGG